MNMPLSDSPIPDSPIPDFKHLLNLKNQAIEYWLRLWDGERGGFRFAPHQPATLMATAYSVLGLEFTQGLSRLSLQQRQAIVTFFKSGLQVNGDFCDPLFQVKDIASPEHDLSYFQEETTTFCQQALDALEADPPPIVSIAKGWHRSEHLIQTFERFPWTNPWLDSNRVMFALSQLCHDADRHQQPQLLSVVDTALDWLDAHQSSETGLWLGPHTVSLTQAMAATFHFTFYYFYRQRPLSFVDRIIDSCLSLQRDHGLFCGNDMGQTCLDYDAIDLLAKASLFTDHRAKEVSLTLKKAYSVLLSLQNSDGGFANCKQSVHYPKLGRKARLLRKVGLSKFIPKPRVLPTQGTYTLCWQLLSSEQSDSNAFSTWFRLLSLCLAVMPRSGHANAAQRFIQAADQGSDTFVFRRLPFLGYHPL